MNALLQGAVRTSRSLDDWTDTAVLAPRAHKVTGK
jgi:hypothetical protein